MPLWKRNETLQFVMLMENNLFCSLNSALYWIISSCHRLFSWNSTPAAFHPLQIRWEDFRAHFLETTETAGFKGENPSERLSTFL